VGGRAPQGAQARDALKLAPSDHLERPFRAHEQARSEGMELHDVWAADAAVPEGATLDDLEAVLRRGRQPPAVAMLFGIRRALAPVLDRGSAGFVPVYLEPEERLYRIENRTVTALAHIVLVDRRPRLAVYVKPRGPFGRAYLALIEPFRRFVVYPSLVRRASASATALARAGSTGPGR
jgi:hypothetical protein